MKLTALVVTLCVATTLGCSSSSRSDTNSAPAANASGTTAASKIKLKQDEIKISHREFAALETQEYSIETDVPMWFGYRTKLTEAQEAKIQPSTNSFGSTDNVAVKLEEVNGPNRMPGYVGNNAGGATQLEPVDGRVKLKVSNFCDCPLEIIVYRKDCTADELAAFEK